MIVLRYTFLLICLFFLIGCYSYKNYEVAGMVVRVKETPTTSVFIYSGLGILKITKLNDKLIIINNIGVGMNLSSMEGFDIGLRAKQRIYFDDKFIKQLKLNVESDIFNTKLEIDK